MTNDSITYGHSISSERIDDLDAMALHYLESLDNPSALDLCCGEGAMALRMNEICRRVVAVDLSPGIATRGTLFVLRQDLSVSQNVPMAPFESVVFQRAIHYFTHPVAIRILDNIREWILPTGGRLFISASGIDSELGEDYSGRDLPLSSRMAPLSPPMAEKHDIRHPVCLYRMEEFLSFLIERGFSVSESFISPFGNLKVVCHVS